MTDNKAEIIERVLAEAEAAAPGPWTWDIWDEDDDGNQTMYPGEKGGTLVDANDKPLVETDCGVYPPHGEATRRLIATAPLLRDELRRLRKIEAKARKLSAPGQHNEAVVHPARCPGCVAEEILKAGKVDE